MSKINLISMLLILGLISTLSTGCRSSGVEFRGQIANFGESPDVVSVFQRPIDPNDSSYIVSNIADSKDQQLSVERVATEDLNRFSSDFVKHFKSAELFSTASFDKSGLILVPISDFIDLTLSTYEFDEYTDFFLDENEVFVNIPIDSDGQFHVKVNEVIPGQYIPVLKIFRVDNNLENSTSLIALGLHGTPIASKGDAIPAILNVTADDIGSKVDLGHIRLTLLEPSMVTFIQNNPKLFVSN